MNRRLMLPVCLTFAMVIAARIQADDVTQAASVAPAATTAGVPETLELGTVEVVGKQRVAQVLLTIKQALKAPDSTDGKDRDHLVCRFVHEMANPQTYLDCATNATNTSRRSSTQMSRMAAACSSQTCDRPQDFQIIVQTLVANQPGQRLHMIVKPSEFRKLMDSVTEGPAAASITSAPAVSTVVAPPAPAHA